MEENEIMQGRLRKLEALLQAGIDPYGALFKPKDLAIDIHARHGGSSEELSSRDEVSIAGRIISLRQHGKASFAHLKDRSGSIQIYIREDEVGAEAYGLLKKLDIGDFLGVAGEVFRTKTGELTVRVKALHPLTKALRPLPEKWHGLTDVEI
ncbi:MAG: OB-fold nucleic acid binding domain-containing protein, partial [Candidatus Methylomirabilales bacterium]